MGILAVTSRPTATTESTATARIEHRVLVEIHGHLRIRDTVHQRASCIGNHAAQNCPAGKQVRRILNRYTGREIEFREERGCRTLGNERAAILNKAVEVHHAINAHSTANVAGRVERAKRRILCGALIRQRSIAGLRNAGRDRGAVCPRVRQEHHVVPRPDIRHRRDFFVGHVRVRDTVRIKRGAHPPFILRARPAM